MLKKILKRTFITVGSIIALFLLFYTLVYFKTNARINKVYSVKLQSLSLPGDSASYAYGKHIAQNRGCLGCHGHDLGGGRAFMYEGSPLGLLYAANITSGKGGIDFKEEDWIKALRHGLGKDNKSLWFMPSHDIYHISNQDMAALLYYVTQQPPVDRTIPAKSLKPLGRILTFLGKYPLLPAELINHDTTYTDVVVPSIGAAYGNYLAITCRGCHGDDMKGGPGREPKEPLIPDISSSGHPGKWKETDFITALRTGRTPEGRLLTDFMPWKEFSFNDDELKAILVYLKGK